MFKATVETKAINVQITSIANRGKAWQEDVQICALNIISHLDKHGDITLVNRLIAVMPAGSRVNALRTWFESVSIKVEFNEDTKEFTFVKKMLGSDMTLAADVKWYDCMPEPAFKPLDLNKMIQNLIKKATKALDSDTAEQHTIDMDQLTALKTLVEVK